MYGLTRGAVTLIGAAVAGLLIWIGVVALPRNDTPTSGEWWWAVTFVALAGLTVALSQLLGGWTKWGWPRVSVNVFLLGFLPALIAGGWVVAAADPSGSWVGDHVRDWSADIGIDGLVEDLIPAWGAMAFGVGLFFGLTFDTTGPRVQRADPVVDEPRDEVPPPDEDDRRVRIHEGGTPAAPQPDPPPRSDDPDR
jgi:hypothetical protein